MLLVKKTVKLIFGLLVLFVGVFECLDLKETINDFPLPKDLVDMQIANQLAEKLNITEIVKTKDLEVFLGKLTSKLNGLEDEAFFKIAKSEVTYVQGLNVKAPVLKGYLSLFPEAESDWNEIYRSLTINPVAEFYAMRAALIKALEPFRGKFESLPVEVECRTVEIGANELLKLYNPAAGQDLNCFLPELNGYGKPVFNQNSYLKPHGTERSRELKIRALCWKFGGNNHRNAFDKAFRSAIAKLTSLSQLEGVKLITGLGVEKSSNEFCENCTEFWKFVYAIGSVQYSYKDYEGKVQVVSNALRNFMPTRDDALSFCKTREFSVKPIKEDIQLGRWSIVQEEYNKRLPKIKEEIEEVPLNEMGSRYEVLDEERKKYEEILKKMKEEGENIKNSALKAAEKADLENKLQQGQAEREARSLATQAELAEEKRKAEELARQMEEQTDRGARVEGILFDLFGEQKKGRKNPKHASAKDGILGIVQQGKTYKDQLTADDVKNLVVLLARQKFPRITDTQLEPTVSSIEEGPLDGGNYLFTVGLDSAKELAEQIVKTMKEVRAQEPASRVQESTVVLPDITSRGSDQGQVDAVAAKPDLRAVERAERKKIRGIVTSKVEAFRKFVSEVRGLSTKDLLDQSTIEKWFECVEFYNKVLEPLNDQLIPLVGTNGAGELKAELNGVLVDLKIKYFPGTKLDLFKVFERFLKGDQQLREGLKPLVVEPEQLASLKTEMETLKTDLQAKTKEKKALELQVKNVSPEDKAKIDRLSDEVREKSVQLDELLKDLIARFKPKPVSVPEQSKRSTKVVDPAREFAVKQPQYQQAAANLTDLVMMLAGLKAPVDKELMKGIEKLRNEISALEKELSTAIKEHAKAYNNSLFAEFVIGKLPASLPPETLQTPKPERPRHRSRSKDRPKSDSSAGEASPGPVSGADSLPDPAEIKKVVEDVWQKVLQIESVTEDFSVTVAGKNLMIDSPLIMAAKTISGIKLPISDSSLEDVQALFRAKILAKNQFDKILNDLLKDKFVKGTINFVFVQKCREKANEIIAKVEERLKLVLADLAEQEGITNKALTEANKAKFEWITKARALEEKMPDIMVNGKKLSESFDQAKLTPEEFKLWNTNGSLSKSAFGFKELTSSLEVAQASLLMLPVPPRPEPKDPDWVMRGRASLASLNEAARADIDAYYAGKQMNEAAYAAYNQKNTMIRDKINNLEEAIKLLKEAFRLNADLDKKESVGREVRTKNKEIRDFLSQSLEQIEAFFKLTSTSDADSTPGPEGSAASSSPVPEIPLLGDAAALLQGLPPAAAKRAVASAQAVAPRRPQRVATAAPARSGSKPAAAAARPPTGSGVSGAKASGGAQRPKRVGGGFTPAAQPAPLPAVASAQAEA